MPNHEPKANFLNMNLLNPLANIPNRNLLAKQITVTEKKYKKKMRYQQAGKRNFEKEHPEACNVNYKLMRILLSS